MNDYSDLLPPLRALARWAGAAILEVYNSEFTVEVKDDSSPVTEADTRAEAIILDGLSRLSPDVPVVSEEAAAAGKTVDISGGVFWLVDPLDGTKEFIKRNGEFTVNIALVVNGVATVGVLFAPVLDRLFSAIPGQAFLEEQGQPPKPIRCRAIPSKGMTVLSSRSHRDPDAFENFIGRFEVADILFTGSSLKLAQIAAGEADLYPRLGRTMEWDIAAGHAILSAAGGCISQLDGAPQVYGKPGFENPSLVAWGTPKPL